MQSLAPAARQAAVTALAGGFREALLACAVLTGIAFIAAFFMRDLRLRGEVRRR